MHNIQRRKPWAVAATALLLAVALVACGDAGPGRTPSLAVDKTSLDFGVGADTLSFFIRNAGDGTLTWTVAPSADWVHVEPAAGEGDGTVTVTVDRSSLAGGDHGANIRVTSNGGSVDIAVTATGTLVPPPPPGVAPGQVTGLEVSGWTLPAGTAPVDTFAASVEARRLLAMAEAFPVSTGGSLTGDGGTRVAPAAMPAGYEGVFVLSWNPTEATAYRIFADAGDGWAPYALISVTDLEDPNEPTYMVREDFAVGDEWSFQVQALNGDKPGEPSEPAGGLLIAQQRLEGPADGFGVKGQPTFYWERHPHATGYGLFVAAGSLEDHVWVQIIEDGETTEVTYPGDDKRAPDALPEGDDYLWYVLTQGPVVGEEGKAAAYSLSTARFFHVTQ